MSSEFHCLERQVFVKESGIHGSGIFTSVDIPKNTTVMKINGEVISGDECERREDDDDNVYIFWLYGDTYLDTTKSNKIRYINHDCKYNCEVEDDNNGGLILIADKDIKAGEELTIDYGYEEIYDDCTCDICVAND